MHPSDSLFAYEARLRLAISAESDDDLHHLLERCYDVIAPYYAAQARFQEASREVLQMRRQLKESLSNDEIGQFLQWMLARGLN